MRRFEAIEHAIAEKWGSDPAVGVCRLILEYVVSKPAEESVMLTFGDFKNIAGADFDQEQLQMAIAILVSRYNVLEMRLVFMDDNEGPIYLEPDEQQDFIDTGQLTHPHSGVVVNGGEDQIFPYYVAKPQTLLEEVAA
ncbi:hypothetical protein JK182_09105 [Acetobacter okinawensis]|uniref:hypothetical protein n=1 Tax=Acetobacter okinawensis TaxID=1076594 RepID=UPI001BAC8B21|nr:hypothetical protein [Acetobacter okinawensis]MBS0988819.1 hypothetical protein [Acetobacter okinawensis]